ncbi:hypothetical protein [Clostridium beijerinckii]|jgi:hypothetical protein|uniref:hypothetical protein n=1 Tax=Clostridium beijerinckii TaxID=1520 RepID=UPI000A3E78E9|nr:hypothetical protein [Clostridium beijerinckii]NOW91654.1 hypothetical protein [Clostridium beijerinckii]NRT24212.1 hypothetical protein [Clostridium beijerinckii]NRT68202.1 hypothetical protein [Clostridium beijerinckii]NRT85879.1 hypothetical protein [Clostridium beijerinckii]NRU47779.1 hypothetical protein [Clostridium beijerinckii]
MLEVCSCMTCPFLGGGYGTQRTLKQINLSFRKCVYSYTDNSHNIKTIDKI